MDRWFDNRYLSELIDKIDLWIWDFDDTLINTAAYDKDMSIKAIRSRSQQELNREFPNRHFFVNLVNKITNEGKRVAIASFGTQYIIDAYMNRLFGNNQKYFTKYNTLVIKRDPITNIPTENPEDKNHMIQELMRKYNVSDTGRIAFFDDQVQNINMARRMGVKAIHIPGKYSRERRMGNKCSLFCEKNINELYLLTKRNGRNGRSDGSVRSAGNDRSGRNKNNNSVVVEGFLSNRIANYRRRISNNLPHNLLLKVLLAIIIVFIFYQYKKI